MGKIVINAQQLQCDSPVISDVTWNGVRYVFLTDWTSQGDYYLSLDPSTNMELSMEISDAQTSVVVFTGIIDSSAPFNATDYQFDVFDYYPDFSAKYQINLKLKLTNTVCNTVGTYTVPITYP